MKSKLTNKKIKSFSRLKNMSISLPIKTGLFSVISKILLPSLIIIILALSVHGLLGTPTSDELSSKKWKEDGPLELSGRYALLYSFVEDHSLQFSIPVAQFATPDLAYLNGNYVSLFAPGVSFIVMPGYLLGKFLGAGQVGSYAVIALFACINALLIRRISMRLGIHHLASTIAGLIFLFATPAYMYSVVLSQHHISTFFILGSLFLLISYRNIWAYMGIWILCGASITVDYPNFFMMFPIGIYTLLQAVSIDTVKQKMKLQIKLSPIIAIVAIIIPLSLFLWFNAVSYGNPFQLSGTAERALGVDVQGKPILESETIIKDKAILNDPNIKKSAINFFKTRSMVNGFYTHFISADRGILYFTPVIFLGFIGLFLAVKNNLLYTPLFISIIGADIILYSMWGDPYGGWSFGSRYLIPSYAILSIFIAYLLHRWKRYSVLIILFVFLMVYSVSVNTLGALTTSLIPPKAEVLELEKRTGREEKYTFTRNIPMLTNNASKSFVYQTYAKEYISAWNYYYGVLSLILGSIIGTTLYFAFSKKGNHEEI